MNTIGNSGISIGLSLQANGHWFPFDGKIDDIGIWNRSLSTQEIQQVYATATNPLPNVSISGTQTALTTCSGLPSVPKPLQVSGSNLRGDITVMAPAGYEISLDPNTGYAASLVLPGSGISVPATTVYLRLRSDATDGAVGLVTATSDMTPVSTTVADGLVAHFNFAGNTNDASSNANHGTPSATTYVVDRFCQPGNAIQMNQGASLVCTQKSYTAPSALSYSVWVKSTSTVGGHLIGFNNGRCTHQGLWDRVLGVQPGSVYFYTYPGAELRTFVPANVLDGAWHHLAVTFDAQGTRIYVDGTLAKHEPTQNRGENFTGYFRVGGLSPNDLNNTLTGDFDDVRIYDRVLSADEVKYLAATHAVGTCPASVTARPTISTAGVDQSNCNNGSFTLSGNTPTIGTGRWTVISGTASIANPSSETSVVTGIPAGTSSVLRWTISNGSCPSSTDDVELTNLSLPTTATAGVDQSNCNNGSFTLSGNTPTIGTGRWTVISGTASIANPSSETSVVTGIPAGTSSVLRWTISNGSCPSSTDDVELTNLSLPTISSAGADQSNCNNGSFTLSGNTPTTGTGRWTVISGTALISDPSSATSVVTGIPAGTSSVLRWTISNGSCPSSTDDLVLNQLAPPRIDFLLDSNNRCLGDMLFLKLLPESGDPLIDSITWTMGDGNVYRTPNIKHLYQMTGTYEINLRVSFRAGCKPDTVRKRMFIHPKPTVDTGPDRLLPVGGRITLNANVSGGPGINFQWSPSNGLDDPKRLRPEATPQRDTRYLLRATSAFGCSDTSSTFITLLLGIKVPNTFTPNGDGYNDRWEIPHLDAFPGVVVEIYDTQGHIVFRSVGYTLAWDGIRNGMKMPAGTYYYVIDPKNGWKKMAGYVTLFR